MRFSIELTVNDLLQPQRQWIGGLVPVRAVLDGGNRMVYRVLVQDDRLDGPTAILQKLVRSQSIPLERLSPADICAIVDSDRTDAVMAEVGPRRFLPLDDLLTGSSAPSIFMLDGVEDPFNLGQAIRSLYAAGASGLVLPLRQWLTAGETIIRSSAGASELMPTATSESLDETATFFRGHGLKILAADQGESTSVEKVDWREPFFLVIGGEKRGISRPFLRQADERVSIPYGRPFDGALGTVAAASIFGYEMLRQRSGAGGVP